MPLINSRNSFINECGLELTATQCEGYAIALGVPFDGVHDGSGTGESGCIQWYPDEGGAAWWETSWWESEETVLVGGGGDGGTESPPVSTASSSVKAPSGGRAWSATEMHSLVEVE